MITGPRQLFIERCRLRGYTLEQVAACIASHDGGVITVDETHPAYPHFANVGSPEYVAKINAQLESQGYEATPENSVAGGCGCSPPAALGR
jgi:hypothetical protein